MNRWLQGAALVAVVGLLATIAVLVGRLALRGFTVRLIGPVTISEPIGIQGTIAVQGPVEVTVDKLALEFPKSLAVEVPLEELTVRASLEGLSCPQCGKGFLLPVRWNLFTGEITWRCTACGKP